MIETGPINADGVYRLNDGRPTAKSEGTVQVLNENGAHTYTLGAIAEDNVTFVPYNNGVITKDAHVRHGQGAILALQVSGVTGGDDLRVMYAG